MKTKPNHGPLPWRIETGGKKNMSAVLDAKGDLVTGSLICESSPKARANHKFIVKQSLKEFMKPKHKARIGRDQAAGISPCCERDHNKTPWEVVQPCTNAIEIWNNEGEKVAEFVSNEEEIPEEDIHRLKFICLIEECAEVIVRTCKAIRFGMEEVQPNANKPTNESQLNNEQRIRYELSDLSTIISILGDKIIFTGPITVSMKKVEKLRKYMDYSRTQGILEEE